MRPEVKLLGYTVPAADELREPLDIIEFAGRVDYGPKSLGKMGDPDIIGRWIAAGHESMLEMVDAAFLVTCSRVVSHELIRHRLASFQQESQRYTDYDAETLDGLFYVPTEIAHNEVAELVLLDAYRAAQRAYEGLRELGVSKQLARYVLPNATRTRIVVKANLREWRHILKLRMHPSAQPEMREVAHLLYTELHALFGDELFPADLAAGRGVR